MFTSNSTLLSRDITTIITNSFGAIGNIFDRTLNQIIKSLFSNNEQGFAYDPNDLSTMYQDATGTVPVTAAGQTVGLMLDKSKGLALGAELLVDSEFNDATKWVLTAGASVSGGKLNVTASVGGSARQNFALKQAGTYKVTLKVDSASGSDYTVRLHNGGSIVSNFVYTSGVGTKSWIITATSPFDALVLQFGGGSGLTAVFDSLYVVELKGNHAYQTTSASRPILRQTPILGVNVLPNFDFTTWSPVGAGTTTSTNSFSVVDGAGGIRLGVVFEVGKTYKIKVKFTTTATNLLLVNASSGATPVIASSSGGIVDTIYTATNSFLYLRTGNGVTTVSELEIKEVTGYRTNQNYIKYDGVDDKLITNLPTALTNCTVVRSVPNVGTQILTGQTIPATYEDNKDHCGLIVINRALNATETSQITKLFDKAAGV